MMRHKAIGYKLESIATPHSILLYNFDIHLIFVILISGTKRHNVKSQSSL